MTNDSDLHLLLPTATVPELPHGLCCVLSSEITSNLLWKGQVDGNQSGTFTDTCLSSLQSQGVTQARWERLEMR